VLDAWYRDVYLPHVTEFHEIRKAEKDAIRAALGLDKGSNSTCSGTRQAWHTSKPLYELWPDPSRPLRW
jgi:hypothetical protein